MASNLLKSILQKEQNLQNVFQWLISNDKVPESNFQCSRGQFVSYFLNFVHSEIERFSINDSSQVTQPARNIRIHRPNENELTPVKNSLHVSAESYQEIAVASTPKIDRTGHLNASICMSPMSPLYNNNHSFTTPKCKKDRSFCLGDFLVARKSSSKKRISDSECTKKSRRINPTNVNERKCAINFNDTENSYSFKEQEQREYENFAEQRKNMLEERISLKPQSFDTRPVNKSRIKTQLFDTHDFKAERSEVTHRNELDVAVSLYSFIVHQNLAINITSEIYCLLSILIRSKTNDLAMVVVNDKVEPHEMFQTIHNILYFIANVFANIKAIIVGVDVWILKNIYMHDNFKEFCDCHDSLPDANTAKPCEPLTANESNVTVNFDTDTDNRRTFPSDQSFHAFRKQRDLFYEILRIWEQNHLLNNWDYSIALGGKIRSLFNLSNDTANFRHMAKLFTAQLLRSCTNKRGNNHSNETVDDELSFLSDIPNVNADKLNRLKRRLSKKDTSCGINALPQFPGCQEFYKQFVTVSLNYLFVAHLKDLLISDILDLDANNVSISEYEEIDNEVDASTKQSYANLLNDLRLLAKFLGYIDALPYRADRELSETDAESAIRRRIEPNIDLKRVLIRSATSGTLIITVPWLISYLAMLDKTSLRLPYYTEFYWTLFEIYRRYKWTGDDISYPLSNRAIVVLNIGWLLELPHFPTETYFNWLSTGDELKLSFSLEHKCLDRLNVVDSNVLYECCPFLQEIKTLLMSNATGKRATVKHITPLSATTDSGRQESSKIKLKLEEAFLNGQPTSTRKTIDFVSERVASACIKYVCNRLVPDYKKRALDGFKTKLRAVANDANDVVNLQPLIDEAASKCFDELLTLCRSEIETIRLKKIGESIGGLLAIDELDGTKRLCVKIANKICAERVEQWMAAHMNKDIFRKSFEGVANKLDVAEKVAFVLPACGRPIDHNDDALSAVHCVKLIRGTMLDLVQRTNVERSTVESVLHSAERSINERCDSNDAILHTINKLLLEMLLLYLTYNHENYAESAADTKAAFVAFWRNHSTDNDAIFDRILCPRNVALLAQSTDPKKTWSLYSELIKYLLKQSLLSHESFEEQCVAIYKGDWDMMTLERLSACFYDVIDSVNNKAHFNYLLSFLSDYCYDLSS